MMIQGTDKDYRGAYLFCNRKHQTTAEGQDVWILRLDPDLKPLLCYGSFRLLRGPDPS